MDISFINPVDPADPMTRSAYTTLVKAQGLDVGACEIAFRIYKDVVHGEVTIEEATQKLVSLIESPSYYKRWFIVPFYGLASACKFSIRGIGLVFLPWFMSRKEKPEEEEEEEEEEEAEAEAEADWINLVFVELVTCVWAYSGWWTDMSIAFVLGCVVGFLQIIVATSNPLYSNVLEVTAALVTSFCARAFSSIGPYS
jgi:uncharacterized membrane protein YjjP (DUF1212 family)